MSGNNVTINTSYLDNLTVGTTTLTFNFSSGASATCYHHRGQGLQHQQDTRVDASTQRLA